jgi:hypothetical protein
LIDCRLVAFLLREIEFKGLKKKSKKKLK